MFIWVLTSASVYGQGMPVPPTKLAKGCFRDSTITYDGKGNLSAKRLFLHNDKGFLEVEFFYRWRGGTWWEDGITTFGYDRRGNVIEIIKERTSQYDCSLGEYSIFSYDKLNRMTSNTFHRGNGQYWEKEKEATYTHDSTGNVVESVLRMWREDLTIVKMAHTYDSVGNETHSIGLKRIGNDWENSSQKSVIYDRGGNKVEEISQVWRDGTWNNYSRNQYLYDWNGNQIEEVQLTWSMGDWKNLGRLVTTYDLHGNANRVLHHSWNGSDWYVQFDVQRHYGCMPFGKSGYRELKLWPNPSVGELNIRVEGKYQPSSVTVIAMNGQRMLQQPFTPKLNVETLATGSYIVEVVAGSNIHRAQFIKK